MYLTRTKFVVRITSIYYQVEAWLIVQNSVNSKHMPTNYKDSKIDFYIAEMIGCFKETQYEKSRLNVLII